MNEVVLSSKPTRESELYRRLSVVAAKVQCWPPNQTIRVADVVRMIRAVEPQPPQPIPSRTPTAVRLTRQQLANRHRAYRAVNHAIARGELAHPSSLRCADGDHQAREYDHYISYEPEHFLSVEPVCRPCHQRRSAKRGQHRPRGVYGVTASTFEEAVALAEDYLPPA